LLIAIAIAIYYAALGSPWSRRKEIKSEFLHEKNCSRLDPEIREISYSDGSQIQIQISKQVG
jgi:hypothetical protein